MFAPRASRARIAQDRPARCRRRGAQRQRDRDAAGLRVHGREHRCRILEDERTKDDQGGLQHRVLPRQCEQGRNGHCWHGKSTDAGSAAPTGANMSHGGVCMPRTAGGSPGARLRDAPISGFRPASGRDRANYGRRGSTPRSRCSRPDQAGSWAAARRAVSAAPPDRPRGPRAPPVLWHPAPRSGFFRWPVMSIGAGREPMLKCLASVRS